MLKVNIEFRKGILFVRLKGSLNNSTCFKLDDNLKELVNKVAIKYIVFNIEELVDIDLEGISNLLSYNLILKGNGGKALVCGLKNDLVKYKINNSRMLNYMFEVSDELGAINVINI